MAGRGGYVVHRQKSIRERRPTWANAARMTWRVNTANWKDVWNVQQSRYDDMVFTRQEEMFRRLPSTGDF